MEFMCDLLRQNILSISNVTTTLYDVGRKEKAMSLPACSKVESSKSPQTLVKLSFITELLATFSPTKKKKEPQKFQSDIKKKKI